MTTELISTARAKGSRGVMEPLHASGLLRGVRGLVLRVLKVVRSATSSAHPHRKGEILMVTRKIALVAAATMASGLFTTGPALAVSVEWSYSSLDSSHNSSSGLTIYAYDGEDDGHVVRADWVRSGSAAVNSITNGEGKGHTVTASLPTVVYKHRIVERVPWANDDEGPWVFPH